MGPESVGAMIGGALVVLHIGGTWLREYRKHRTWRANGKDIGEIKQDVKAVKEEQISQGKEISAMAQSVNDQKENCKVTVGTDKPREGDIGHGPERQRSEGKLQSHSREDNPKYVRFQ